MWSAIFGWSVIGVLVPLFIGIGGLIMSISPSQLQIAKVCFTLAAIIFLAKIGAWLIYTQSSMVERMLIAFVIFGIIGVSWTESLHWIDSLEAKGKKIESRQTDKVVTPLYASSFTNREGVFYAPPKDPASVLDYSLDWSAWLAADKIATSTWTYSTGIVGGPESIGTDKTTVTTWLSGGMAGATYIIGNKIITTGGRTVAQSFRIQVQTK